MSKPARGRLEKWIRGPVIPAVLLMALTYGGRAPVVAQSKSQAAVLAPATAPQEHPATASVPKWVKISVNLPASSTLFPPGTAAEIANSQCLICHSAEMVMTQPALTLDEWTAEIGKMRGVYGAPLPADGVEALARYLHDLNGR
jgi:hypothetical protein